MTPNTDKARAHLPWIRPPSVIDWAADVVPPHRTEMRRGTSCVLAKTEEGLAVRWVESADCRQVTADPRDQAFHSFVKHAPAGVAVLATLELDYSKVHGVCVLGDSGAFGGPDRWASSAYEDHAQHLVTWGLQLAQTARSRMPETLDGVQTLMVERCLQDDDLEGYWLRGPGTLLQLWRPLYGIELVTRSLGLCTREGYDVCDRSHGLAAGQLVSTTYRGVRQGRLVDRGDILAPTQAEADDLHVDDRLVRYWHGEQGRAELAQLALDLEADR